MADATLGGMPPEIMSIIMEATHAVEISRTRGIAQYAQEPILTTTDIFALRLTSRRLEFATADNFGQNFFAYRRHMLSRDSIQCLVNIAACPKLRKYVKEVAFGPECVSPSLDKNVKRISRHTSFSAESWARDFAATWLTLLEDQKAFNDKKCGAQIKEAIRNLPSLQNICLEPSLAFDAISWKRIWGARRILRQLGFEDLTECRQWSSVQDILFDYDYVDNARPGHHHRLLQALCGIKTKSWGIGVAFREEFQYRAHMRIDFAASEWIEARESVRALSFQNTLPSHFLDLHKPYLIQLMQQCHNLTNLKLYREFPADEFLGPHIGDNLHSLTLKQCEVQSKPFAEFLKRRSNKLQNITIVESPLLCYTLEDLENGVTEPSWTTVFDIMLAMPRLNAIRLDDLTMECTSETMELMLSANPQHGQTSWSIAAHDNKVKTILRQAVCAVQVDHGPDSGEVDEHTIRTVRILFS